MTMLKPRAAPLNALPPLPRTRARAVTSGEHLPVGMEVRLPVIDPSSVLVLCAFQQPGRGQRTSTQKRTSLWRRAPPQLLG